MNTKHTPGPWQIARNDFCAWITNQTGKAQIAKAFQPAGMTPETCDANAKLIASAPDLLAALELCGAALTSALSVINAEDETGKAYPVTRDQIAEALAARAAIARATA